jgi:hypothetical protein
VGLIACTALASLLVDYSIVSLCLQTAKSRIIPGRHGSFVVVRHCPDLLIYFVYITPFHGPGSSVGIATSYGLDRPGTESRWGGEIFRTCPDRPWGPPSLLYNGYRVFPGGKDQPGRDADPSLPSSAVVMK